MGVTPWWAWLLPVAFSAPWLAAIAWTYRRTPRRGEEAFPSLGEQARRRLMPP